MIFGFSMQIFAIDNNMVNTLVSGVGNYLSKTVPTPQVGSVGGEWLILGLARSGADIPTKYFDAYYKAVTEYVVKRKGILHEKKVYRIFKTNYRTHVDRQKSRKYCGI